jgi:hypothetical protein
VRVLLLNITSLGVEIADVETRTVRPNNCLRDSMRMCGGDVDVPLSLSVMARIEEKI